MPQYSEKTLIKEIETKVASVTNDYKVFVGARSPLNHAEYKCEFVVVAPLEAAEAILKTLMDLVPVLSFGGSQVELGEERGVDILKFEYICKYFPLDERTCENDAAWGVSDEA